MTSGGPLIDTGKWAKKLIIAFVLLLLFAPLITSKISQIMRKLEQSEKRAALIAGFPQAVCAEERSIDYQRSMVEPLTGEVRAECRKRVAIHMPPHLRDWNFTSQTNTEGLKFRFFRDSTVYQVAAGEEIDFGQKGRTYESCPEYNGICEVVYFEVATVSGKGSITFSKRNIEAEPR